MITHDEFVEKECYLCGTQRCYGIDYCGKYKTEVLGEEDPMRAVYEVIHNSKSNNDLGFGENWVSESPEMPDEDREAAEAAQEAHDNLIRSLVEAGGTIREARELLVRSLEWLYMLGYDSGFTNPAIDTLTNDIKKFLEDTE